MILGVNWKLLENANIGKIPNQITINSTKWFSWTQMFVVYVFVFGFHSCIVSLCRFFVRNKNTLEIPYENHISDIKRSLKWFRMCFVSSFFPLPKNMQQNKNLNYKQITSCLVVRLGIQIGRKSLMIGMLWFYFMCLFMAWISVRPFHDRVETLGTFAIWKHVKKLKREILSVCIGIILRLYVNQKTRYKLTYKRFLILVFSLVFILNVLLQFLVGVEFLAFCSSQKIKKIFRFFKAVSLEVNATFWLPKTSLYHIEIFNKSVRCFIALRCHLSFWLSF